MNFYKRREKDRVMSKNFQKPLAPSHNTQPQMHVDSDSSTSDIYSANRSPQFICPTTPFPNGQSWIQQDRNSSTHGVYPPKGSPQFKMPFTPQFAAQPATQLEQGEDYSTPGVSPFNGASQFKAPITPFPGVPVTPSPTEQLEQGEDYSTAGVPPYTLFKTPRLFLEESTVPITPFPPLFMKSKSNVRELSIPLTPFPTIPVTPPPTTLNAPSSVVQEQSSAPGPLSDISNITTLVHRAIVPSSLVSLIHPSSDDPTVKLLTPSTRLGHQFTLRVSTKWYLALAVIMILLPLLLPSIVAWAPAEWSLFSPAPSLAELDAAITRSDQYITQLFKPINDQTGTIGEYYGVPLRVYLTQYNRWILLGENSTAFCTVGICNLTSAIFGVVNRQSSETFIADFRSPKDFDSPQIRVDVNWNYDAKHYQIKLTNEQFSDQNTTAIVYLYDLSIGIFSSNNVGHSTILTYAKTDIAPLHTFRYTIRHGNQLAQNYYWYKQDRQKYEQLARFLVQQGYQLDYDIYAPIWGYGTSYPDDLPYRVNGSDGYEVYHDCHASPWNDDLDYRYQSKICKVGLGIYVEISRRDLLIVSLQAIHILNKYGDPERPYSDGESQRYTPVGAVTQLEKAFNQSRIGIPMCSPVGCNYGLASGLRTFDFGVLETLLGYTYGRMASQDYADTVARLVLDVQIGDNDTILTADGGDFYRPAQKGAFYLSWDASMRYSQSVPFGYEYLNDVLNMPNEYHGVLVSDMETSLNAYAFLVLYRCKKYGVGCASGAPKPPVTGPI